MTRLQRKRTALAAFSARRREPKPCYRATPCCPTTSQKGAPSETAAREATGRKCSSKKVSELNVPTLYVLVCILTKMCTKDKISACAFKIKTASLLLLLLLHRFTSRAFYACSSSCALLLFLLLLLDRLIKYRLVSLAHLVLRVRAWFQPKRRRDEKSAPY